MPHRSNTNPFRDELDTDSQSLYEERRKSRNNPFFQDINTGPGNTPSRPNLNKYSSDNIAPGNKPSRPNLNKYSSDNIAPGNKPSRPNLNKYSSDNIAPGNKPSRPNLNKYSSDNIAPGNKPSRPNLNKYSSDNIAPGNKPSRPNLNKYSSDNIAPGNKPSRPNLNKYSSDNALHGATPRRSVHRSKTDRSSYRHSVGVNELLQGQRGGSSSHGGPSSHGGRDKNVSSRRHSKVPKELELDTIDKLDVTGIFFGGGFHHDGPFDAARPQRTRHSRVSSPIMAFPRKSSSNNIVRSHTISASSSEVFTGHNGLLRKGTISGQFGSKAKSSMIHGDASVGLGSTTFLDGAPASQEAIKEDIRNHIRRNKTIKDNRRKSIADFLRGDFDLSNVSSSDAVVAGAKEPEVKKGNKFLRRIKSLRRS
ncbi:protein Pal1p [Monosporozyma servazzii]